MEPPVTPKPNPAPSSDLPTDHTGKLFGIVYITLTGVIDTIIPAISPWSWVGKSFSYLFKLYPQKNRSKLPLKKTGWPAKNGSLTHTPFPELQKSFGNSYQWGVEFLY
ncbi:hypothetical protein DSO57_1007334 [Entomophthora muscae]|uniref:Uncharacterized protein n=1 Tax=Entomophthora muscae TaxID=34485 RepID=A0ACC2S9F7_9FUNG|nr:hypothetical protein DSO57_1007334 [Entomophthora muscae]